MPDWLSHILIGLIFAEVFNIKKKSLVVLGSLLPDFISKAYLLGFFTHLNDSITFISALYHSPVMGFIIPAFIIPFFKYKPEKTYFFVFSGFMLHLLADSFTKNFATGTLLYPFSYGYFSFNLFWPEQYWIILLISIITYALVRYFKYNFKRLYHYF